MLFSFAGIAVAQDSPVNLPFLSQTIRCDSGTPASERIFTPTLKQRFCSVGRSVISPQFALTAGFAAAFGQWRNAPHLPKEDFDDVAHRFGAFYARRSARYSAEAIAGYLHHEDPRFRPSVQRGFWHRTESAAMNVVSTPGDDGSLRLAYAPIAGALSSAMVRSVVYRQTTSTPENILLHAAGVYSFYFARDFFKEFRPELDGYARRLLKRGK